LVEAGGSVWGGDQADGLRRLLGNRGPQVVAFASGREACGRTTLLVQTAAALAAAGHGVVVVDENPAPDNTLAPFGLSARLDLWHALQGERSLQHVMVPAAPGVVVVPASRAVDRLDRAAEPIRRRLAACLRQLQEGAGFVLIDCAARRGGSLSALAASARHLAVVVTAQGPAITNAYALIKRMAREQGRDHFQLVITRARSPEEARAIFGNMRRVAGEHLGVRLDFLGAAMVPVAENLADALVERLPPSVDDGDGFLGAGPARAVPLVDSMV
jgi:flagellar biosynthesis protein FlhG